MTSVLPDVDVEIQDGQLGQIDLTSGRAVAKLGVCSKGTVGTAYGFTDVRTMLAILGGGNVVEAAATQLQIGGGPVYIMPVTPATLGTATAGAHTGTGAGTVAFSIGPAETIVAKITTGGVLGTMAVAFSVGGRAYTTPVVSSASPPWVTLVPGTLTKWSFPAATYVINETNSLSTAGAFTASGGWVGAVTQTSSPMDAISAGIVTIVQSGGLGVGTFTYSLDGGANTSPEIAIPAGGKYVIPGTGIILTFASTFVEDDTYAFTATAAAPGTTELTTGLDSLFASSIDWGLAHLVATPTSAATAASLAAAVDTKVYTARTTGFRFVRALVECPTTEVDATVASAFASFASTEGRTWVAAGDYECVSPITGRAVRRNAAWAAAGRVGFTRPGKDGASVKLGPIPGAKSLYRNEEATPALDAARFITMRTFQGKQGYYLTNIRSMAVSGSDYTYGVHCRVMDAACKIARAFLLDQVNEDVRVNATTGYIDERDAQAIERGGNARLKAGLVDTDDASAVSMQLRRDQNILSTNTEPVTVSIISKAYTRKLSLTMGFRNPALQQAAA